MKQVNLYEAKTRLSSLVEEAGAGEEIVIAKNGRPIARLVAMPAAEAQKKPRRWGFWAKYGYKAPDNLVELLRTDQEEIDLWENGPVFPEDEPSK